MTAIPSDAPLGLSVAVHDRDEGNNGWIEWDGGILGGKNNAEFNIATLVDGSN